MWRTIIIVTCAVAAVAVIGLGLTRHLVDKAEAGALPALTSGRGLTLKVSDKPVDMPPVSLTDLDGRAISNESLRGKVVLMNFWATWCGPCREEIPMLVALQEHYKDKLVVVGVSIDERPASEVKEFAAGFFVNYPIAMAPKGMGEAFGGISAVPSTFVVNPEGRIVQRHVGMLQARRTEHEVRALAGLPTDAVVETVKDTGQVLLSNAAYATEIPGVDLTAATPAEREAILKRLNTDNCTCGCGLTVAQCRINDPSCEVSLPVAKGIAKDMIGTGKH
jgi:thiol-disulfide isomerase/thioredoxin